MMSWIKVEDGYPENNTKVLAVLGDCIYIGEYLGETDEGNSLWVDTATNNVLRGVSAWMPLPEEPKKEKENDDELETKIGELKELVKWLQINGERLRGKYALIIGIADEDTGDGTVLQIGDADTMIQMLAEAVRPFTDHIKAKE